MVVLVTGGTGFIGGRVVRSLLQGGHRVRCVVRPGPGTTRLAGLDVEIVHGRLHDQDSLLQAMAGAWACIHLASPSGWGRILGPEVERPIVDGTRNVVCAAVRTGCRRLVYISSSAAIGATDRPLVLDERHHFDLDPDRFHYAAAKAKAEEIALALGDHRGETVVVNPAETYGPGDDDLVTAGTLHQFLDDWPALVVRGGTSIAHVDDVAAGIVAALEQGRPGQRYILGGDNLTVRDLARIALRCAGRPRKPIVTVPRRATRLAMRSVERLGLDPPTPSRLIDYGGRFWYMDSSKAKAELGYRPRGAYEVVAPTIGWLIGRGR